MADYTQDANCQGAWLFKEGSGTTVADSSQNSYIGNFYGVNSPTWDATDVPFNVSGSAPNSVDFDGTDDDITVNSGIIIADEAYASVTGWFKTSQTSVSGGHPYYCERGSSGNDIWKICIPNDNAGTNETIGFIHRDDSGTLTYISSNTTIDDGEWHHFSVVKSGTDITIYLDGSDDGGGTLSGNDTLTNTLEANIGSDIADARQEFVGNATDIAIFNRELDSTEVNEIYDYGLEGPGGTPSASPSASPSGTPSVSPSESPSVSPSQGTPSVSPSGTPSESPSGTPSESPSGSPSGTPSESPSGTPSESPSGTPSESPSGTPSESPSASPSPSATPSGTPSVSPSGTPSETPSESPSVSPSESPSGTPSETPSVSPSESPSESPSVSPSGTPSVSPSGTPSVSPSASPSASPSGVGDTYIIFDNNRIELWVNGTEVLRLNPDGSVDANGNVNANAF